MSSLRLLSERLRERLTGFGHARHRRAELSERSVKVIGQHGYGRVLQFPVARRVRWVSGHGPEGGRHAS